MKFKLEIDMGNAAFDDNNQINEVQRILGVVQDHIDIYNRLAVNMGRGVMDANGNPVGQWYIED